MLASILALWHKSPHQIAGLVPKVLLFAAAVAGREAVFVGTAHLPIAMPHRLNQQWCDLLDAEPLWGAGPDATGIDPMGLGQPWLMRLYLVLPPLPHSTGSPTPLSRSKRTHLVALRAEAIQWIAESTSS